MNGIKLLIDGFRCYFNKLLNITSFSLASRSLYLLTRHENL